MHYSAARQARELRLPWEDDPAAGDWIGDHNRLAATDAKKLSQCTLSKAELTHISDQLPGVRELNRRCFDMLLVAGIRFPDPKNMRRFLDLSQSIRHPRVNASSYVGCITPKMEVWISDLARLMTGSEAMNFQGIHYGTNGKYKCSGSRMSRTTPQTRVCISNHTIGFETLFGVACLPMKLCNSNTGTRLVLGPVRPKARGAHVVLPQFAHPGPRRECLPHGLHGC